MVYQAVESSVSRPSLESQRRISRELVRFRMVEEDFVEAQTTDGSALHELSKCGENENARFARMFVGGWSAPEFEAEDVPLARLVMACATSGLTPSRLRALMRWIQDVRTSATPRLELQEQPPRAQDRVPQRFSMGVCIDASTRAGCESFDMGARVLTDLFAAGDACLVIVEQHERVGVVQVGTMLDDSGGFKHDDDGYTVLATGDVYDWLSDSCEREPEWRERGTLDDFRAKHRPEATLGSRLEARLRFRGYSDEEIETIRTRLHPDRAMAPL